MYVEWERQSNEYTPHTHRQTNTHTHTHTQTHQAYRRYTHLVNHLFSVLPNYNAEFTCRLCTGDEYWKVILLTVQGIVGCVCVWRCSVIIESMRSHCVERWYVLQTLCYCRMMWPVIWNLRIVFHGEVEELVCCHRWWNEGWVTARSTLRNQLSCAKYLVGWN